MKRRAFLAMPAILAAAPSTDARIDELTFAFQDYRYRAPYKFGGKEVDRVTMLNVRCRLSTRGGKSAEGGASMSMGNVWSFPAPGLDYDVTLAAMKSLAEKIVRITRGYTAYSHPLDVNHALEPEYLKAAVEVAREMTLPLPVPKLCVLVTASPVDAAIHDAFGKLHGRSSYAVCGREFVRNDLAHYLNPEFRGEYLDRYISLKPVPRVRMYHSVGASDALTASEVRRRRGRRPAGDAGRVDPLQRRHRDQNQIERRGSGVGRRSCGGNRSRHLRGAGEARPSVTGSTRSISTNAAPTCSTFWISSTG